MEIHTYYSKKGLLRVTWGDRVTMDSLRRHFQLLRENTHYARELKIITSSEVEEIDIPMTEEYMLQIQKWRQEVLEHYVSIRGATYGMKPVPAAYIDYFAAFFDGPKSTVRQFTTEEKAMEWLMVENRTP